MMSRRSLTYVLYYSKTAPSLPQQGNNPAHSSASTLISQQQTELPDSSTLVQASSLSIDGQSSTGESQTSALHHTSGRSTIGRMQPMVIQSAIQSSIQHNPLDTVLQPMNQQQQHPEPSTNQQFFVQQTERTQQANTPLQQLVTGELSNLHPSQPNNLLNQHQSQGFMLPQPQQLDYAALYNEDSLWDNSQSSLGNFDVSENENDALYMQEISERLNPCSQPSIVPGIQDDIATMNEVEDQEILEREKNFDKWADIQRPSASDTQMKNIGDEDGCFDSTGLTVKEDSNCFFKTGMPTNLKKRKYAHLPCSSG
ncbi:hypothetical protein ACP4OV_022844 [Aristida adscensionis]